MAARDKQIRNDLRADAKEPWEGCFYSWDPFRLGDSWIISRKHGYVSTSKLIDMGRVEASEDRIRLISESPSDSWEKTHEYVVIRWGKRVYLVEPDYLLSFCNAVNSGMISKEAGRGSIFLLRGTDDHVEASGLPQVPKEYKEYLLTKPVTGTIVKINGVKEDVAVHGERFLHSGLSITLDRGKRDGVRSGMEFFFLDWKSSPLGSEVFVISLTDRTCEVLVCGITTKKGKLFKRGVQLSTADSLESAKDDD
ncbi:MAG TPA: hypothetical protein VMF69_01995 [Gemmataceae bacterium]|nr:hypothetical protein [Gemmataceae bacterium]